MSTAAAVVLPEEQLLELLTQLQKTTPDQARAILNAQPQIGYALVPLMVKLGIVNLEVLQKTLVTYSAPAQAAPPQTVPAASAAALVQAQTQAAYRPTPPPAGQTPAYPPFPGYPPQNGYAGQYAHVPPSQPYPALGAPQYQQPPRGPPAPAQAPPGAGVLGALGSVPDEQKEMIMRVISMTPEQVNRLPPQERAITIQLRATLGLPTE
ncbi:hypothetical protein DFH11DRAFT_1610440 [Phellopilus nigrolimitatus]|nr:hypothetical protein DFH11DRAFT_1610440 [Phellopilus nigrolimitatus]